MSRVSTGLAEVDPPTKGSPAPAVWSPEKLKAVRDQLEASPRWLTDKGAYHSRSAAYHHAGMLVDALAVVYKDLRVKRKTWVETDGFHWAIRKE